MQTVNVPPDRLGVPVEEFVAALDEAVRRCRDREHDPYLASVLATLAWVAGISDQDPLTRQERPATRTAQEQAMISAGAIVVDAPDPIFDLTGTIHPDWARGVERTLGWVRGPDEVTRLPQPTPGQRQP